VRLLQVAPSASEPAATCCSDQRDAANCTTDDREKRHPASSVAAARQRWLLRFPSWTDFASSTRSTRLDRSDRLHVVAHLPGLVPKVVIARHSQQTIDFLSSVAIPITAAPALYLAVVEDRTVGLLVRCNRYCTSARPEVYRCSAGKVVYGLGVSGPKLTVFIVVIISAPALNHTITEKYAMIVVDTCNSHG